MGNSLEPTIIKPFSEPLFLQLRDHVAQLRKAFDAPGSQYHDANATEGERFNRWCWHNLPLLVELHHSPRLIQRASELFCREVKPSYVFLSMYGPDGVCPLHTDRPQCQFTIDLQIESDGRWPIYIDGDPHILSDGEAIAYSGTGQPHFRAPMNSAKDRESLGPCTFMNLAFFHFVPTNWMGRIE